MQSTEREERRGEMELDATTGRISAMLGVSAGAVEEFAAAGLLPCERMGRGAGAYWAYDSRHVAELFDLDAA